MVIEKSRRRRAPRACGVVLGLSLGLGGLVAVPSQAAPPTAGGPEAGQVVAPEGVVNPDAPRAYFPADVTDVPATDSLPDLFTFFGAQADPNGNGRVDSADEWDARRAELADLLQYYLFGHQHPTPEDGSEFVTETPPGSTTPTTYVQVTDPDAPGATTARITISSIEAPVQGVDTDLPGPYPAVLVVGRLSNQQVATLKANGYGYVSMNTRSVYSDGANNPHTGAYNELYPYQAGTYEYDSGTLMGWAWGISRIVDAIKNDGEAANRYNLAWDQTAVTGVSRNGKAAVLAAAFDDRIAVAAPSDPGGGGLTGFRYLSEGQMFTYNTPVGWDKIYSQNETVQRAIGNPSEIAWFSSKAQDFYPDTFEHAPFDLHAVAALVAPRPLIGWTGEAQQAWLNSPSTVLSLQASQDAYELLGAGENVAWVVRDAAHANQDRDLPDLIAIMDKTFGRSDTLTRRHFDTLAAPTGAALDRSGMIYPEKTFESITAMSRNPYDITNSSVRWARPGKHTLWSPDTFVTAGLPRTLTFHTDANRVTLTLPDGRRLTRGAPQGVATFTLSAEQAQSGRYVAETQDRAKDSKAIELAGYSLSDALRHGLNNSSGAPDGVLVGFSSPLSNYGSSADPVVITVDGTPQPTSIYDDGTLQGYVVKFGASLKRNAAPAGPWDGSVSFVLGAHNLKLEALPGYTLGVDVGLTKSQVPDWRGLPVNGFASTFGERPSWGSDNLQNTPLSGNHHGAWPLFPNSLTDDGSRPATVPVPTAFDTQISVDGADASGFTLRFSEPLDGQELGLAMDIPTGWTAQWADDATSVRVAFTSPAPERTDAVSLLVFRAADTDGNMIGGPLELSVPLG